jgi:hypothetical protein
VGPKGELLAAGRSNNGVLTSPTVWAFSSRGSAVGGFGSHGVAKLTLPHGELGEATAVAVTGSRTAVIAGDENAFGQRPSGLAARLVIAR